PVLAACLVLLRLGAHVAALRTRLVHRFVPDHEVAVRIVGTSIERLATSLGAPLDDVASVLRTLHARRHRPGAATLRESAAAEELAAPPVTDQHLGAAFVAHLAARPRRLPVDAELPRVGALLLELALARDVRPEESAARHETAAAFRAPLRLERGEI